MISKFIELSTYESKFRYWDKKAYQYFRILYNLVSLEVNQNVVTLSEKGVTLFHYEEGLKPNS